MSGDLFGGDDLPRLLLLHLGLERRQVVERCPSRRRRVPGAKRLEAAGRGCSRRRDPVAGRGRSGRRQSPRPTERAAALLAANSVAKRGHEYIPSIANGNKARTNIGRTGSFHQGVANLRVDRYEARMITAILAATRRGGRASPGARGPRPGRHRRPRPRGDRRRRRLARRHDCRRRCRRLHDRPGRAAAKASVVPPRAARGDWLLFLCPAERSSSPAGRARSSPSSTASMLRAAAEHAAATFRLGRDGSGLGVRSWNGLANVDARLFAAPRTGARAPHLARLLSRRSAGTDRRGG